MIVGGIEIPVGGDQLYATDGMSDTLDCSHVSLAVYEACRHRYPEFGLRVLYFWLILGSISCFLTLLEYVVMLMVHERAVLSACLISGLPKDLNYRQYVISGLARAALDLPHSNKKAMGVDPMAGASPVRVTIAAIFYKLKRSLLTFLLRILVKRVFSRAVLKAAGSLVPVINAFVGVPVNMLFNGLMGHKVMRSARILTLGCSIAMRSFDCMLSERRGASYIAITETLSESLFRAVSCTAVCKREWHPNVRLLLSHICKRLNFDPSNLESPGDPEQFLALLQRSSRGGGAMSPAPPPNGKRTLTRSVTKVPLYPFDKSFLMKTFAFACILDGYVQPELYKIYKSAAEICLFPSDVERLRDLAQRLIGARIELNDIAQVFGERRPPTCCQRFGACCDTCLVCFAI
jgi:hypothetical protein